MAFGRRNRPSLLRTATRAAVIGGSATAASNAVNARTRATVATPVVSAVPVTEATEDVITRIERLAALHTSGALTDAEFTALKAQAIAG